MIVKKLAAPLINEKILQQAEHCYIATTSLSEAAFDFLRSRIPTKTKLSIVSGLEEPTSPMVLRSVLKHYQDRIIFNIYTRNTFHANVYIFDLPFRKSIAFVGTGHFTLGGLKEHEEIFIKVTDPKEIETFKSWFTSYFEFGEPLNEAMIDEYEPVYLNTRERQLRSKIERRDALEITSRAFSWDQVKFKNQFFNKDDYAATFSSKATSMNPVVVAARENTLEKFRQLFTLLHAELTALRLLNKHSHDEYFMPTNPGTTSCQKVTHIGISLMPPKKVDVSRGLKLCVCISQKDFWIMLSGDYGDAQIDREMIKHKLTMADYRKEIHAFVASVGKKYSIEVAGERRWLDLFQSGESLAEFMREDDWRCSRFIVGKSFSPGDGEISKEMIVATVSNELKKLLSFYGLLTDDVTAGS